MMYLEENNIRVERMKLERQKTLKKQSQQLQHQLSNLQPLKVQMQMVPLQVQLQLMVSAARQLEENQS